MSDDDDRDDAVDRPHDDDDTARTPVIVVTERTRVEVIRVREDGSARRLLRESADLHQMIEAEDLLAQASEAAKALFQDWKQSLATVTEYEIKPTQADGSGAVWRPKPLVPIGIIDAPGGDG